MKFQPLADRIRPTTLADVVGQPHILGQTGLLRRIVESGNIPNMIFYGPSGVGKTTVASIIAAQTERKLYRLNATTASIADIKKIFDELGTLMAPNGALIYLDEIQYLTKNSSSPCWSSSRTVALRSLHPRRKIRIFTCFTRF